MTQPQPTVTSKLRHDLPTGRVIASAQGVPVDRNSSPRERTVMLEPEAAAPWLLLQEITHRVTNEYCTAASVLSVAAAKAPNPEAKVAISAAAERLYEYAKLHAALQKPNRCEQLDLSNLSGLCRAFTESRLRDGRIRLTIVADELVMGAEPCWLAGLILSQLISNAAKHAFCQGGDTIRVELSRSRDQGQCIVTDNGSTAERPRIGRGMLRPLLADLAAGSRGDSVRTAPQPFLCSNANHDADDRATRGIDRPTIED
jgi:two-component sensor histidine kinase